MYSGHNDLEKKPLMLKLNFFHDELQQWELRNVQAGGVLVHLTDNGLVNAISGIHNPEGFDAKCAICGKVFFINYLEI